MYIRETVIAIAAACMLTSPLCAQGVRPNLNNAFEMFDLNSDGFITQAEAARMLGLVFSGMDREDQGKLSLDDFRGFSLSLAHVARENGRTAEFAKAREMIFRRWDADGDGWLTLQEFKKGASKELLTSIAMRRGMTELNEEDIGSKIDMDSFKLVPFVAEQTAAAAKL